MIIAEVVWVDAHCHEGWHLAADARAILESDSFTECRSVGWLAYQDETAVKLVMSLGDDGDMDNILSIPMACVKSITKLPYPLNRKKARVEP